MRNLLVLLLLVLALPAAAADWVTVTALDGSTLAMPGTPRHSLEAPAVEGATRHESWSSRGPEGAYSARLTEAPQADGPPGIGRAEMEFMASDMHGRLTRSRPVTLGTLKGWEFQFTRSRHGDLHYVLWAADPRRDVMLTLRTPLAKPADAAARRFFDSLELAP